MNCEQAERLIARAADDEGALAANDRSALDRHVESCIDCAAAVAAQRAVAALLRHREQAPVPSGFAARVASRIDAAERVDVIDMVDWRRWTAGAAPVAAALLLAAYLGAGTVPTDAAPETTAVTLDSWGPSAPAGTPAAVFLEPGATPETLLETVLTGVAPSTAGESNER